MKAAEARNRAQQALSDALATLETRLALRDGNCRTPAGLSRHFSKHKLPHAVHRFCLYPVFALTFAFALAASAVGTQTSRAQPALLFEPRLDAATQEPGGKPRASISAITAASSGAVQCLGRGKVAGSVLSHIDFSARPLQREMFQGSLSGAPAAGTVVRFYSDPLEFMGDFDSNGSSDTVRAITEVAGPGGADPCPAGPNGNGCMMGERIVEEPFLSSSGHWTIPADLPITRSEGSIPEFAPNTFEIRFTETGSLAYQAFTSGRIVQFPIEIWDIGPVPPGTPNDPADDRRMAILVFSEGGSECDFNLDEYALNEGRGPTASDRLYAYYFAAGSANSDWEDAVNDWIPASEELGVALTGEVRACSNGAAGPFGCNSIDLLSYLPFEVLGNSPVNDLWGWTDPQTGREYALVARVDGLSFVDISDPVNPQYLGQMPTATFGTTWRDVKVYANTAYVVADNAGGGGIQVFDLTRLRNVTGPPVTFGPDLATNDFIGDAHNIAINADSGFLYGGLASGTCGRNGIAMVDLTNPLNPAFSGCMTFNDPAVQVHDLHCVNYDGPDLDYAGSEICFTANEEDGLGIASVTDKSNPFEIARADYPLLQYAHQGWLTEDHRYFIMGDELDELGFGINTRTLIWDVTDLDDPQLATAWEGGNTATDHNLYVKGDFVYEANYSSGLRLVDISDIKNPREVGSFDTFPFDDAAGFDGAWSTYPFFDSGTVAITSRNEGLVLVRLVQGVNVVDAEEIPSEYRLSQNYPNPFNPATTIAFSLPESATVRLAVFDLLGRQVKVLVHGILPAGSHSVVFDAGNLPSGTYMYRLEAGGFSESRQLSLLR